MTVICLIISIVIILCSYYLHLYRVVEISTNSVKKVHEPSTLHEKLEKLVRQVSIPIKLE